MAGLFLKLPTSRTSLLTTPAHKKTVRFNSQLSSREANSARAAELRIMQSVPDNVFAKQLNLARNDFAAKNFDKALQGYAQAFSLLQSFRANLQLDREYHLNNREKIIADYKKSYLPFAKLGKFRSNSKLLEIIRLNMDRLPDEIDKSVYRYFDQQAEKYREILEKEWLDCQNRMQENTINNKIDVIVINQDMPRMQLKL